MTVSITRIPDALAAGATVTYQPDTSKNTSEAGISGRKLMRPILRNYLVTVSPESADEMQAIIMAARGSRYPLAMRDYAAYKLTAEPAQITADGSQAKIGKNWVPATGPLSYFERVLIPDGTVIVSINGSPVLSGSGWTMADYGILTLSPALNPATDDVVVTCNYLKPVCMLDAPAANIVTVVGGSTLYQFSDIRLEEIFEAELVALTS
jgi:hypothetical protein